MNLLGKFYPKGLYDTIGVMARSGPTPSQKIKEECSIRLANGNSKVLLPGTFVKAIRKEYVPYGHPLEEYDESFYVAIFSPYGLGLVPRRVLEWDIY